MVWFGRTALFGESGSGKSTFRDLVVEEGARIGLLVHVIKLAKPLYDIQEYAYSRLNLSIEENRQDGILLSFLAQHFRSLRSDALTSIFAESLSTLENLDPNYLILCDDARPADSEVLRKLGFTSIRLYTNDDIRRQRRSHRGDATTNEIDPNDTGLDRVEFDQVIENNGDIDHLRESAVHYVRTVLT